MTDRIRVTAERTDLEIGVSLHPDANFAEVVRAFRLISLGLGFAQETIDAYIPTTEDL